MLKKKHFDDYIQKTETGNPENWKSNFNFNREKLPPLFFFLKAFHYDV